MPRAPEGTMRRRRVGGSSPNGSPGAPSARPASAEPGGPHKLAHEHSSSVLAVCLPCSRHGTLGGHHLALVAGSRPDSLASFHSPRRRTPREVHAVR